MAQLLETCFAVTQELVTPNTFYKLGSLVTLLFTVLATFNRQKTVNNDHFVVCVTRHQTKSWKKRKWTFILDFEQMLSMLNQDKCHQSLSVLLVRTNTSLYRGLLEVLKVACSLSAWTGRMKFAVEKVSILILSRTMTVAKTWQT